MRSLSKKIISLSMAFMLICSIVGIAPIAFADTAAPENSPMNTSSQHYKIIKNFNGGSNGSVIVIDSTDGTRATLYPKAGATVTFRTSPNKGYTLTRMSYTTASGNTVALSRIEGSGKPGTNSVYSFKMPAQNVTLNATFTANTKSIYKSITGSGQLMIVNNPDGSRGTLYPQVGQQVCFKAIPGNGYKLSKINYVPESTGKAIALTKVSGTASTYTFNMPNSNVMLNGVFTKTQTAVTPKPTPTPPATNDTTVYVTNTGTKYHRGGCPTLKSKIPISLTEAKAQGYTACKVCKPPA